ncbi:hypothetical protein [Candidatus Berkiella aquae]|uniref:Uncharacterized protein n=1 Tax=Candidatus Berkiella aquae TaxID=295108 RepID=A0A0Q9YN05_9GAMM|nr:hypothetical protein [Candidatus Berkiella aquae]MCS5712631.1 hypothetical protein [Candidatus Berkiella aquae]
MNNLYRNCPKTRDFLTILLSLFLMGWFTSAYSQGCGCAKAALYYRLQPAIANDLNDEKTGITDVALNQAAQSVWQEVIVNGYATRVGKTDKEVRTLFAPIQYHIESHIVEGMTTADPKAVMPLWVIHAPQIATPLVTEGRLNNQLVSDDVANDKDKTRLNTALLRAKTVRDYLAKGGILLVVYQDTPSNDGGRTKEQKRIFDKLKKRYASQIIDFPVAQFPQALTGATYLVPQKNGVFEMTNRGAQIQQDGKEITWGLWLQEREHPKPAVKEQIHTLFQFLEQAGLQEKIASHAKQHGRAPETFFALGKHYQS